MLEHKVLQEQTLEVTTTGPEFTKFQKAVEDREKWRKLVVKSSVVSQ